MSGINASFAIEDRSFLNGKPFNYLSTHMTANIDAINILQDEVANITIEISELTEVVDSNKQSIEYALLQLIEIEEYL